VNKFATKSFEYPKRHVVVVVVVVRVPQRCNIKTLTLAAVVSSLSCSTQALSGLSVARLS